MQKPENVDDYIELIDQAIFETAELIACANDEGEGEAEFSLMLPAFRELEAGLKALRAEIMRNEHRVGGGHDLPFMPLVQRERKQLPFVTLLDAINLAYKKGFRS